MPDAATINALGGFAATEAELAPFIAASESLVSASLTGDARETGLRLLVCHLYSMVEPPLASESGGSAATSYAQAVTGLGLNGSRWGQMYKALVRKSAGAVPFVV
jgi:hypothetical protein